MNTVCKLFCMKSASVICMVPRECFLKTDWSSTSWKSIKIEWALGRKLRSCKTIMKITYPTGACFFEINNINTRKRWKICSKLTLKTPRQHPWRRSCLFVVNVDQISHMVLVFLLLTLNKKIPAGVTYHRSI